MNGGKGSDRLLAKDGFKDTVNCGKGTDTAAVDAGLDHLVSIEHLI